MLNASYMRAKVEEAKARQKIAEMEAYAEICRNSRLFCDIIVEKFLLGVAERMCDHYTFLLGKDEDEFGHQGLSYDDDFPLVDPNIIKNILEKSGYIVKISEMHRPNTVSIYVGF